MGERSRSSCCLRSRYHRCRHVEQEPDGLSQAAGDVKDVTVLGLEANGDHLEEKHDDPVLPDDAHVTVDLSIIREEQGIINYIDYVCRHPSLCKNNARPW